MDAQQIAGTSVAEDVDRILVIIVCVLERRQIPVYVVPELVDVLYQRLRFFHAIVFQTSGQLRWSKYQAEEKALGKNEAAWLTRLRKNTPTAGRLRVLRRDIRASVGPASPGPQKSPQQTSQPESIRFEDAAARPAEMSQRIATKPVCRFSRLGSSLSPLRPPDMRPQLGPGIHGSLFPCGRMVVLHGSGS